MTAQTISLRPRYLDIGLAPHVDAWLLRSRMAAGHTRGSDPAARKADKLARTMGDTAVDAYRRAFSALHLGAVPTSPATRNPWRIALRTGRWRIIGLIALTPAALAAAAPPMLAIARLSDVRATYGKIVADRAGITVHMGSEVAGIIPRPGSKPGPLVLPSHISAGDDLYKMYDAAEGAGHRWTYFGWPVRSMLRALVCHLGGPIPGECGGASGGLQHAIRGLNGGYGGDGDSTRKVLEFLDAPALSLLYRDKEARAALILDNVSFGYLPGGRPIFGISNASRAYWAEPDPRRLSLAKKALLLGVFKYPMSWDVGQGISQGGRTARQNALNRARDVLLKTFGRDNAQVIAALRELDEPGFLPLRPAEPLIEFDNALGGVIATELAETVEADHATSITDIELTIPSVDGLKNYQVNFVRALAAMEHGGGFTRPLLGYGNERADGLAVNTANDGAVLAFAATSQRINLNSRRRVGSHGKWVALLAMAKSGQFRASSILCNRAFGDIQNAGGDRGVTNCSRGPGLVPIVSAFARSLNLPLLDATHRLNDGDLRAAAAATDFRLPPSDSDPRRSLILGNAEADPRSVIALGNALSNFARGGEAVGSYPYIVRRVRIDGAWESPTRRQSLDLRSFLHTEQARRLIAAVCPAPFNGGTLAALKTRSVSAGVLCGKSATVSTGRAQGYSTISKAIVVSGPAGTWYTYLSAPDGVLGASNLSILPLGMVAQRPFVVRDNYELSK